jgi:hypothetical protein
VPSRDAAACAAGYRIARFHRKAHSDWLTDCWVTWCVSWRTALGFLEKES